MVYIHHRINTISSLWNVSTKDGIEVDVRYHENTLILHHDPFHHHQNYVQTLESLLCEWHHAGPLILNVKTEGVEQACIDLMNKYQISSWFFLDLSMPYFAAYAQKAALKKIAGFSRENLCVRFSEYEDIAYALGFAKNVSWVWVDCFTHCPLDFEIAEKLKNAGFKICLVSPELQGHPKDWIEKFQQQLCGISIDAVCTKYPYLWRGMY